MLDGAAAQGQDPGGTVQDFGDDLVLQGPERGLAVLGEDLPDRAAGPPLDHLVAVGERESEPGGEQAADRALARSHETDEDDHGCAGASGSAPEVSPAMACRAS